MSEIIYNTIFYLFVVLVIGSAVIVAFSRNIVHSAFALLVTFFGVAGIYVFLGADFLAIAQVVIYVGGILVLILFAVMLTSKIMDVKLSNPATSPYIAGPLVLVIFVGLVWLIMTTPWQITGPLEIGGISDIGKSILGEYLLAFEIAAVLLLGALLGAAYLARSYTKDDK